jgi:hypothetical protein
MVIEFLLMVFFSPTFVDSLSFFLILSVLVWREMFVWWKYNQLEKINCGEETKHILGNRLGKLCDRVTKDNLWDIVILM